MFKYTTASLLTALQKGDAAREADSEYYLHAKFFFLMACYSQWMIKSWRPFLTPMPAIGPPSTRTRAISSRAPALSSFPNSTPGRGVDRTSLASPSASSLGALVRASRRSLQSLLAASTTVAHMARLSSLFAGSRSCLRLGCSSPPSRISWPIRRTPSGNLSSMLLGST